MTGPRESGVTSPEILRQLYVTRFADIVSAVTSNPEVGYGGLSESNIIQRGGLLRLTPNLSLEYIAFRQEPTQNVTQVANLIVDLAQERTDVPRNALVIRDQRNHTRTTFATYNDGSIIRTHVFGLPDPERIFTSYTSLELSRELDHKERDAFLEYAESPAVHWRERFVASRLTQSESELLAESMAPDFEAQQEDIRRRRAALENRAEEIIREEGDN